MMWHGSLVAAMHTIFLMPLLLDRGGCSRQQTTVNNQRGVNARRAGY